MLHASRISEVMKVHLAEIFLCMSSFKSKSGAYHGRKSDLHSIPSIKLPLLDDIKIRNEYEVKLSICCKRADADLVSLIIFPSQQIISFPNFPFSLSVFQSRSSSIFFQILSKTTWSQKLFGGCFHPRGFFVCKFFSKIRQQSQSTPLVNDYSAH